MSAEAEPNPTEPSPSITRSLLNRISRGLSILRLIRFRPFDTSTPGGRAQERHRRVLLTSLASFGARGLAIVTMLISVPLTLHYLGTERYGLWMTASSVIGLMGFADLGLGYGLMNAISDSHGRDDRPAAQRYVTSALVMLTAVGLFVAALFLASYPWVNWSKLFNVKTAEATAEAGPAVAAFICCFVLNLPLLVVQRVQTGYQEGFAASLWQGGANLVGFALLLVAIHLHAGLPWLILAMVGGPALIYFVNTVVVFGVQKKWLTPSRAGFKLAVAKRLLGLGFMFLILQTACVMAFTADNVIIARVLGTAAVPRYSIASRMFALPAILLSILITPLWPAYGEAISRGDVPWVKRTLHRSMNLTLAIAIPSALLLIVFGKPIIRLWTGNPQVVPTTGLLVGLGLWLILGQAANALGTFLNGAHVLRFQALMYSIMAVTNIWLSVVLARHIGVAGVIWGTVITTFLFVAVPSAVYIPSLLKRMSAAHRQQPLATSLGSVPNIP